MGMLLLKHLFSGLLILDLIDSVIGGAEGPDRIFVGGLPYYFSEEQIRELLESFGCILNSFPSHFPLPP